MAGKNAVKLKIMVFVSVPEVFGLITEALKSVPKAIGFVTEALKFIAEAGKSVPEPVKSKIKVIGSLPKAAATATATFGLDADGLV